MQRRLVEFVRAGGRIDRICYGIAAVLLASGVFHLVVQLVTGDTWIGPVSFRKPTTFGVAFGLTLATITWVTTYVRARARAGLLAVFAVACVAEVAVITAAQWRGVPSHFNVATTTVNAVLAMVAAAGGGVLVVVAVLFAVAALRRDDAVPLPMRVAVRAGFAALLCALAIGVVMIAVGVGTVRGGGTLSAAYALTAAFKSGHAATMHGILIMPVLAWLGGFTGWSARRRLRVVLLGCAGYVLAAGVVVVDTFLAVNPLAPLDAPAITTALTALGLAALVTAGVTTLVAVFRSPLAKKLPRSGTLKLSP